MQLIWGQLANWQLAIWQEESTFHIGRWRI